MSSKVAPKPVSKKKSSSESQPSLSSSSSSSSGKKESTSSGSGSTSSSDSSSKSKNSNNNASNSKTKSSGESKKEPTTQELEIQEKRPGLYKRIAVIRYIRPMLPSYDCWGHQMGGCNYGGYGASGPSSCGCCFNGYGYPGGIAGEFSSSPRALIIPPSSKKLFRPAVEKDFENNNDTIRVTASLLRIKVPCHPQQVTPAPPVLPPPQLPPPRNPQPQKPPVEKTKIIDKYIHESKHKPPSPKHDKKPPPPKKKPEPPKKPDPPKKKPEPPKKKPEPPKEKKLPPKPPPKPEPPKPVEPPKPITPPPPPPPPPPIQKSPPSPPPHKSSSESSFGGKDKYNFEDKTQNDREHHFQSDVRRRGSSFDAVADKTFKVPDQLSDTVAPQRWKGGDTVSYQDYMSGKTTNTKPMPPASN